MKKFVLASLFVVAAAAMQPALAAKAAEPKLCGKGTKICACGKMPAALWQCCNAKAKCDCSGGAPELQKSLTKRRAASGGRLLASYWLSCCAPPLLPSSITDGKLVALQDALRPIM
jgi:hypothetical protein